MVHNLSGVWNKNANCQDGTDCKDVEQERGMTITKAIMFVGIILIAVIALGSPTSYDYHTDLKNIAYQLSRIADALNRGAERCENEVDS